MIRFNYNKAHEILPHVIYYEHASFVISVQEERVKLNFRSPLTLLRPPHFDVLPYLFNKRSLVALFVLREQPDCR
jgi:hypothetical protein